MSKTGALYNDSINVGDFSAVITVAMMEYFKTDLVEKRILAILMSNGLVFLIAYFLYAKEQKRRNLALPAIKLLYCIYSALVFR